jgi:hypothetical protein
MRARALVNIFQQMDIYKTLKGYSAMYLTESITTRLYCIDIKEAVERTTGDLFAILCYQWTTIF